MHTRFKQNGIQYSATEYPRQCQGIWYRKIATIKQMSGKTYPVLQGVIHKHNVI